MVAGIYQVTIQGVSAMKNIFAYPGVSDLLLLKVQQKALAVFLFQVIGDAAGRRLVGLRTDVNNIMVQRQTFTVCLIQFFFPAAFRS